MADFDAIPQMLQGTPLRPLRVRWPSWATADTPCYLIWVPTGQEAGPARSRLTLQYVPGAPSNDAEVVTINLVKYWEFKKPAEWTTQANIPRGLYSVRPWIGALDGFDNEVPTVGFQIEVIPAEDGGPL